MTIKDVILKEGWDLDCNLLKSYSKMEVRVIFDNHGVEDETEFDIKPFDVEELEELFREFCIEENIEPDTAIAVVVSNVGEWE